jgi:tetratricopeptide (TPR) repeat protein
MNRTGLFGGSALLVLCSMSILAYGDTPPGHGSSHGAAGVPVTLAQWAEGAQLFDGLGNFHRTVTTTSKEAQAYFDQGMRLLWAFNHDESSRSFAKAAQIDPGCAMCLWGVALTVGPNYNLPMMAEPRAKVAWEALQQAKAKATHTTPVEQALIGALAARYPDAKPLDPSNEGPILAAYAQAMQRIAQTYPDDSDVQTLTAEALMNINAWKLWSLDGKPTAGTEEIVALLEGVLAKNPGHPGANHYYIHAIEASPRPEKAVAAAERLPGIMPAAGHLEHMPAHIMQRVGRYADAATANRKGADADIAYFAKTTPPDYYAMYTAHNYQFLAFSTAMQGRKADTLDAARRSRAVISDPLLSAMPGSDWYVAELYTSMVRFGMWDELLAEAAPDAKLAALTAGYRYARATALAAKGRIDDAVAELTELEKLAAAATADDAAGLNSASDVLAVAVLVGKARIAQSQKHDDKAVALLTEAATKEDQLAYDEPSDWFFPVRHLLGLALLRAGRPQDAEQVYQEDLRRHPENGWALYGLAQSLAAQHKDAEALSVRQRFDKAWTSADIALTASAF